MTSARCAPPPRKAMNTTGRAGAARNTTVGSSGPRADHRHRCRRARASRRPSAGAPRPASRARGRKTVLSRWASAGSRSRRDGTMERSRARSARTSAMVRQTRVLTSSWDRRNSGLIWLPPRSVHSRNKAAGGFSFTSRVSRFTRRYSSSTPTVNGGSELKCDPSGPRPALEAVYRAQSNEISDQLCQRLWQGHVIALREVDTDPLQLIQHSLALDPFGYGLDSEGAPDLADRLNHAAVNRIGGDLT